jgi:hypothetical protein
MFYVVPFSSNLNIMEADSVSFNKWQNRVKNIPLLQHSKMHYRIHKSPPLILIPWLFESNPHIAQQPTSLSYILIAAAH